MLARGLNVRHPMTNHPSQACAQHRGPGFESAAAPGQLPARLGICLRPQSRASNPQTASRSQPLRRHEADRSR
jgi:hypothetical protein